MKVRRLPTQFGRLGDEGFGIGRRARRRYALGQHISRSARRARGMGRVVYERAGKNASVPLAWRMPLPYGSAVGRASAGASEVEVRSRGTAVFGRFGQSIVIAITMRGRARTEPIVADEELKGTAPEKGKRMCFA